MPYFRTSLYFILKIFEKVKASAKMHDKYGLGVLPDELYLKGNYVVKPRCKNISKRKFRILDDPVQSMNLPGLPLFTVKEMECG